MFDLFESLEIAVEPIAVALFIVGLGLTASVTLAQEPSNSVVSHTRGTDMSAQEANVNQPRQVEIELDFQKARLNSAEQDLLRGWNSVVLSDPGVARTLVRKPALLSDQAYLEKHPRLQDFVAEHPDFPDQFADNPGNFVVPAASD